MRHLALALALAALPACNTAKPAESKVQLRNYLTEVMRKNGWSGMRTDEDSRARKPTKYTDAIQGLAFTIRHTASHESGQATMGTWVYEGRKERDAAKAGFQAITDDLNKGNLVYKTWPWDVESPELHMMVIMESANTSMANQFQLLFREFEKRSDEIAAAPK